MRKVVVVAALALGLALMPACGGGVPASPDQPTPAQNEPDPSGARPDETRAGAVASLGSEEEDGGHFTDMVDMLRGRVAGLQVFQLPNGDISLRIRGLRTSFMANEEPLLVVDGVPVPTYSMSSALRTMSPSDVRSIQVLKDVGSTAAYGTRGVNGVILIRLKRP